nr:hypothetical protein [Tanacetum cinerariifolium]
MTMATTIEQQVALDEALVPSTQRLRIGRSNFILPSDIQSKESTMQVVYDVLRSCPFFKAFLVTADVPEIYMQEFWATAYVHQHSIRFNLDNKKHIINLETFRDMLHICPRIPGQSFDDLPFEEDILEFLRFLEHSAQIRTLTDVNINKLFQPWRSFGAVINKCLTRKSFGFDSFRFSQAQILWGLYHSRNIDYAFLIWEDFMYQVEHKNQKKSNEMYYPRFTKVIIHHFMSKDLSILRRNKVNWDYVKDDILFLTIKMVSRHQNTQQYGAMLSIELTNEEIRNSKAYKEYYACATGEAAPKPKASARRKRSGLDTFVTPSTAITTPTTTVAVTPRLTAAAKGKQPAKAKSPSNPLELARTEAQQLKIVLRRSRQETHISQLSGSGTDEGTGSKPGVPDVPSDDSEEEISWNSLDDEDADAQEKNRDDDEGDEKDESDDGEEDNDDERDDDDDEEEIAKTDEQDDTERGGDDDEETESDKESDGDETREEESFDPIPRSPEDSEDDGNGENDQGLRISEEERIHEEEDADELYHDVDINYGKGLQLSQDIEDSHMNKAVRVAVQIQTDRLRDSYQRENDEFLRTIDDNMKRIIKEQVKTDLSEMELKKILIEKMEDNKSIQRSDEQRNLYKALVEAYEADKIILNTYGERIILKRRRDDDDDQGAEDQPIIQSSQHPKWFSQPKKPPTPDHDWNKTLPAAPGSTQTWISELAKQADSRSSFNELLDTPLDFSNFIMNRLKVDTLTPELLAGPTYELMKGSCNSLIELEYHLEEVYKATTDQLDWVNPEGQQYPHNLLQPLPLIPDNQGRRVIPFAHFINNDLEYLRGGASSRKYTTSVTKTKAADYGNIKWIEDLVSRSMWIKDPINYDKHALWGVSHWGQKRQMFTRSIIIQQCVEDHQLGVKSYQKRLNLTKPDTYRSDLKRQEAYTAYSNPRGFIYQNKDKKNRLMRIDELYKFSDRTLNDVRNALDNRLKRIRM